MVYDSFCVGLYLKTAFGQVDIANDFSQIVSVTLMWHFSELYRGNILVTLSPIKLLYSFLESLHNVRIVHFCDAKVVIYFVKSLKLGCFFRILQKMVQKGVFYLCEIARNRSLM